MAWHATKPEDVEEPVPWWHLPAAIILLHLSELAVSPVQAGIHLPIEDAPECSSAEVSSIHLSALAQGIDPAAHAQPGAWQQNDLFD